MEQKEVFELLESIGFKKNEITIYLDLIRFGKSSPMDVAKRTELHRSNIYDILEKLKQKGIVDETIINEKKYYYPIDPEDLYDYLKQKQKELEKAIPEIKKIQDTQTEERRVSLSEGLNSAKNIISRTLDFKGLILAYGIPREIKNTLGAFIDEFHRQRIKKQISMKIIYESKGLNQIKKLNEMDFTEARYLPLKNTRTSTLICCDKVILIIWDKPITTIIIQSSNVAEAYKEYFNIIWQEAKVNLE